jgi:hypothetical protein
MSSTAQRRTQIPAQHGSDEVSSGTTREHRTIASSPLRARRWFIIVAPGLAGILALVSMVVDPVPTAEGRELLQGYAEDSGRQGLHTNLLHYGFVLFAPVAFALVAMVRGRGAWLANVAGLLAVLGLTTLPGMVTLDFFGVAAVNVAGLDVAEQINDEVGMLPGFVALVVPAFLASLLALPLATLAMWRAGLLHWAVPLAVTLGLLGGAEAWGGIPGFALLAASLVFLSVALWRMPIETWHSDRSAQVAAPAH